MDIYAWAYADSLKDAKRIYSDTCFSWDCPDCKVRVESVFDKVPLISYGSYCHVFYCDDCGYESEHKMYELVSINDESVSIKPSDKYNLVLS